MYIYVCFLINPMLHTCTLYDLHQYIFYTLCTCVDNVSIKSHLSHLFSVAVSTLDSPAVEARSNPGSGKSLMSENLRLYTTSSVVVC